MSSKKKSKPNSASPRPSGDPSALADQAAAALRTGHAREAVDLFKELLKRERRPEWMAGLASAYASRAEQLVAKGMIREALALWRTRADACGVPLIDGPYVSWMLKSGQTEQALALLRRGDLMSPELQSQFAAAVLVAPPALLAGLPAEMPLMRHRPAAQAAFSALARGDFAAMDQALQAIPFRSPYRALRSLLKLQSLLHTDRAQAEALMARLGDAGSFAPLAAALRVCLLPGDDWVPALGQLDDAGRALVLDIKGCPEPQRALAADLLRLAGAAPPAAPAALFDLLLRQRQGLPARWLRSLLLRLLPSAPQRRDAFNAALLPLSPFEQERQLAQSAAMRQQHEASEQHWLRVADLLAAEHGGQRRAALVLRRLADDPHYRESDGLTDPVALEWLERSVDLDPDDLDTQRRLVRALRLEGDLKRTRTRLDAARERFPDDAALLLEAVETALASGAFKKAAGLAKQLLQQDPLNPQVRSLIGQAHLSHARKQIDTRHTPAALRELDEAEQWLRGAAELGQVKLLRGLIAEAGPAGDALLREALADLGGPLVGGFHLLMEAARAKLDGKRLLRRAGADGTATPTPAELVALAQILNARPLKDRALRPALETLLAPLQRAAETVNCSEGELTRVCEALHRQGLHTLLQRFARAALRRWPEAPIWIYFEVAGRVGGSPRSMPERDMIRLENALDRAEEQGDKRTALRVIELLRDASSMVRFLDDEPFHDLAPSGGEMQNVLHAILEMGGTAEFLKFARQKLGKADFDQLRAEIKGNDTEFARALIAGATLNDPDPLDTPPPRPPRASAPRRARPDRPAPPLNQKDLFDE